ncbi:hypothetical protein JTB14_013890 [Gonioctena quinquepunctata]|nr:hypothetical protein JTB14_013890 [Gonioctena quinquepunctata]
MYKDIKVSSSITQVKSMRANHCDDRDSRISADSIRDVAECPKINPVYYSESETVIRRDEISLQHEWTCLIELTRSISHYSMHSHSSVVAGGIMNYIYRVGAEEYCSIHRYRTLKIYQQNIGEAENSNGTCEGSTYRGNEQVWKHIILGKQHGRSVLYELARENSVFSITDRLEEIKNQFTTEHIIFVGDNTGVFAVKSTEKVYLCQLEIWQTDHPRIPVIERKQKNHISPKINIPPHKADLMAYVNSKFLYVEQAYTRKLDQLYTDTVHRRCLIKR